MTGEPADPYDLPRQRHGTTPQMFDVALSRLAGAG